MKSPPVGEDSKKTEKIRTRRETTVHDHCEWPYKYIVISLLTK